jgi:hypothetical protein
VNVGDLVEYIDSFGNQLDPNELGTITRDDHAESNDHCYVVWHTTDNQGWWSKRCLRVVSKYENR